MVEWLQAMQTYGKELLYTAGMPRGGRLHAVISLAEVSQGCKDLEEVGLIDKLVQRKELMLDRCRHLRVEAGWARGLQIILFGSADTGAVENDRIQSASAWNRLRSRLP